MNLAQQININLPTKCTSPGAARRASHAALVGLTYPGSTSAARAHPVDTIPIPPICCRFLKSIKPLSKSTSSRATLRSSAEIIPKGPNPANPELLWEDGVCIAPRAGWAGGGCGCADTNRSSGRAGTARRHRRQLPQRYLFTLDLVNEEKLRSVWAAGLDGE